MVWSPFDSPSPPSSVLAERTTAPRAFVHWNPLDDLGERASDFASGGGSVGLPDADLPSPSGALIEAPSGADLDQLLRELQTEFLPGAGQEAGLDDVVNPLVQSLRQGKVSSSAVRQAVSAGGAVGGAALCSAVGAAVASPLCAAAGQIVADTFADLLGIGGSGSPGPDPAAMRKQTRAEKQAWMDKLSAIAEDQDTIFELKEIIDLFFNEAVFEAEDPYSIPMMGGFFLGPLLYEQAPWLMIDRLGKGVADYVLTANETLCLKDANSLDYTTVPKGFGIGCFGNPTHKIDAGSSGFGGSYIVGLRNWPAHIASAIYHQLKKYIPSIDDTRYTKEMLQKYGDDQPYGTNFLDWGWRDLLWSNVKNILNVEMRARIESALIAGKLKREGKFLPVLENIETTVQAALGCTKGDQECKEIANTYTDQMVQATLNNDQAQLAERRHALAEEAHERGGNTALLGDGSFTGAGGGSSTDEESGGRGLGFWATVLGLGAAAVWTGYRVLNDQPIWPFGEGSTT